MLKSLKQMKIGERKEMERRKIVRSMRFDVDSDRNNISAYLSVVHWEKGVESNQYNIPTDNNCYVKLREQNKKQAVES